MFIIIFQHKNKVIITFAILLGWNPALEYDELVLGNLGKHYFQHNFYTLFKWKNFYNKIYYS